MGKYRDIRDQIVTIVGGVQQAASNAFVQVLTKPTTKFTGYPAAVVLPDGIDSRYITVAQNQRGYGVTIYMYYPIDQENWATAINTMLDLVDAVLDALDQSVDLSGKADFLQAVPLMWDVQEATTGKTLVGSIHAVAIKDVDVR